MLTARRSQTLLLGPLALAAVASCAELEQALEPLTAQRAEDGASTGQDKLSDALGKDGKEVQTQTASFPMGAAGAAGAMLESKVPPLLAGDPPLVVTYMPFSVKVTTAKEGVQYEPLPASLEVSEPVVLEHLEGGLVSLRIEDVESILAQQKHKEWCWAACSEAVNKQESKLKYSQFTGTVPSQEEMATYFRGDGADQRAPVATIMRAINLDLELGDLKTNGATLQVAANRMSTDVLVDALLQGRLAVIGLGDGESSHACVAVGVTFGVLEGGALRDQIAGAGKLLDEFGGLFDTGSSEAGEVKKAGEKLDDGLEGFDELASRYAVAEVVYFDPLEPKELKRMGSDEFAQQCLVIMSSEFARMILKGEGLTAQEIAGDSLDGLLGD